MCNRPRASLAGLNQFQRIGKLPLELLYNCSIFANQELAVNSPVMATSGDIVWTEELEVQVSTIKFYYLKQKVEGILPVLILFQDFRFRELRKIDFGDPGVEGCNDQRFSLLCTSNYFGLTFVACKTGERKAWQNCQTICKSSGTVIFVLEFYIVD